DGAGIRKRGVILRTAYMSAVGAVLFTSLALAGDVGAGLLGTWEYAPEKPDRSWLGSVIIVEQSGPSIVIKQGWTADKPYLVSHCPVDGSSCTLERPKANAGAKEGETQDCKLESGERRLQRTCTTTTTQGADKWVKQDIMRLELAADG